MAKDSALTALAAADCVAADIVRVVDTSVTTGKKIVMSDLIDAGARASQQGASGIIRYDGTTILVTGTTLSLAGKQVITSANAAALAVGRQGATNPVLNVDASVATNVTGISIIGRAAAAGVDILVTSSGTNENLVINAKGSGTIDLNPTGTGNVLTPRAVLSRGPTAGVGYATGAGGAVTQATNRTTGVTLNTVTGAITTNTASLAAGASATFIVTNSAIAVTDTIVVSVRSGQTNKETSVAVTRVAAGAFDITVHNQHAATAEVGAIIINFTVIKGVAA